MADKLPFNAKGTNSFNLSNSHRVNFYGQLGAGEYRSLQIFGSYTTVRL